MTWDVLLDEMEETLSNSFGPRPETWEDSPASAAWDVFEDLLIVLNHEGVI